MTANNEREEANNHLLFLSEANDYSGDREELVWMSSERLRVGVYLLRIIIVYYRLEYPENPQKPSIFGTNRYHSFFSHSAQQSWLPHACNASLINKTKDFLGLIYFHSLVLLSVQTKYVSNSQPKDGANSHCTLRVLYVEFTGQKPQFHYNQNSKFVTH